MIEYTYLIVIYQPYNDKHREVLTIQVPKILTYGNYNTFILFSNLGKELSNLQLGYENLDEYPLIHNINNDEKNIKLKLDDVNKQIIIDKDLILTGLPDEVLKIYVYKKNLVELVVEGYKEHNCHKVNKIKII